MADPNSKKIAEELAAARRRGAIVIRCKHGLPELNQHTLVMGATGSGKGMMLVADTVAGSRRKERKGRPKP